MSEFKADNVQVAETIQSLWSGYGQILRLNLIGSDIPSVILKKIAPPTLVQHPRGWNTSRSHERKLRSYQVEITWYEHYASICNENCRVPRSYFSFTQNNEQYLVLEDLDAAGFYLRKSTLNLEEIKVCLRWLAHFHAIFLNHQPDELWEVGTYWHLATRPDELAAMKNGPLKDKAAAIDRVLNHCQYKTLVHGDAKVANFCFTNDVKQVAAVDFQYVGGGCGMKDVIYLMGSCLSDEYCEKYEQELLNYYFSELKQAVKHHHPNIHFAMLEKEWRSLYALAWTDFTRFLLGWMPTHSKINDYAKRLIEDTLRAIEQQ